MGQSTRRIAVRRWGALRMLACAFVGRGWCQTSLLAGDIKIGKQQINANFLQDAWRIKTDYFEDQAPIDQFRRVRRRAGVRYEFQTVDGAVFTGQFLDDRLLTGKHGQPNPEIQLRRVDEIQVLGNTVELAERSGVEALGRGPRVSPQPSLWILTRTGDVLHAAMPNDDLVLQVKQIGDLIRPWSSIQSIQVLQGQYVKMETLDNEQFRGTLKTGLPPFVLIGLNQ